MGIAAYGAVVRDSRAGAVASLQPPTDPTTFMFSFALATDGASQGGFTWNGASRAALWRGTAATWVDLHPAGAYESAVHAIEGLAQYGYVSASLDEPRAAAWAGSAASLVSLHPAGAESSDIKSAANGTQAGYAIWGGAAHAGVWAGSASSWRDLRPVGATSSCAWATDGARQAGSVEIGSEVHAALWSGTAASFIDLNPQGADASAVYAIAGGWQVGEVSISPFSPFHAAIWNGSPDGWVDLGALLPAGYTESAAYAVGIEGDQLLVGGRAWNQSRHVYEGVVWSRSVPAPGAGLAPMLGPLFGRRVRRLVPHRRPISTMGR